MGHAAPEKVQRLNDNKIAKVSWKPFSSKKKGHRILHKPLYNFGSYYALLALYVSHDRDVIPLNQPLRLVNSGLRCYKGNPGTVWKFFQPQIVHLIKKDRGYFDCCENNMVMNY